MKYDWASAESNFNIAYFVNIYNKFILLLNQMILNIT